MVVEGCISREAAVRRVQLSGVSAVREGLSTRLGLLEGWRGAGHGTENGNKAEMAVCHAGLSSMAGII